MATPYRSTWLDNTKAKFLLEWRPTYDLARLVAGATELKTSEFADAMIRNM